jgi:hypothetical protein
MSERRPHPNTPDRASEAGARLAGIALLAPPLIAAITVRPLALSIAHWIAFAFGLALYAGGARRRPLGDDDVP